MTASDASRVERSRSALIVLWIAQIAVASLVLLTGASKLASAPAMVVEFDAIGVGQWFRYVVGSIEVASAVLLAIPSLAAFGALLLIPVMIGAVAVHLFILGGSPAPALVALVVSSGIAWARRERFASVVTRLRSKVTTASARPRRHQVVIVRCGFGGLFAAKALRRADVDVIVIDRTKPPPVSAAAVSARDGDTLSGGTSRRRSATFSVTSGTRALFCAKVIGIDRPSYMAPETARGHTGVDGRTDSYSLACAGSWRNGQRRHGWSLCEAVTNLEFACTVTRYCSRSA